MKVSCGKENKETHSQRKLTLHLSPSQSNPQFCSSIQSGHWWMVYLQGDYNVIYVLVSICLWFVFMSRKPSCMLLLLLERIFVPNEALLWQRKQRNTLTTKTHPPFVSITIKSTVMLTHSIRTLVDGIPRR